MATRPHNFQLIQGGLSTESEPMPAPIDATKAELGHYFDPATKESLPNSLTSTEMSALRTANMPTLNVLSFADQAAKRKAQKLADQLIQNDPTPSA